MFADMENLKIESVIRAPSSLQRRYENRASHALILKYGGGTRYFFEDRTLVLEEGQLLWIPKGCSYTVQRQEAWESEYCLINFQADIPENRPILVNLPPRLDSAQLCRQLTVLRILNTPADRYRLMALFYELAACLCESRTTPGPAERQRQILHPALEYMRRNIFDPELRVGQLHKLCDISDTYFRRLFQESMGTTPRRYIIDRRLAHAKDLLDNGEYDSVGQAARLSGFEDALYFSKAFKARYGYPPSQYSIK